MADMVKVVGISFQIGVENGMMHLALALCITSARRTSTERAQRVLAARLLYQRDLAVRRRV